MNDRNSPLPPCETPADDRTSVTVELVEGPDAGEDASGEVCETNVQETFPSENAIENFYLSLLEDGVPRDGTFSPGISQMASQYQNDADGLGDFTTTYTIGEDNCQDSVELTQFSLFLLKMLKRVMISLNHIVLTRMRKLIFSAY